MPTHAELIKDITRRDDAYEDTGRPRIGGSSYSSGVFREQATGKLWLGKAPMLAQINSRGQARYRNDWPVIDEARTEGLACGEKVASDIYGYYGVPIARVELSRQRITNPLDPEDTRRPFTIHVMSELLEDFQTYKEGMGDSFECSRPNPNGQLELGDGRVLEERGLGRVLAVASFLRDVDVIGNTGANIGFQIQQDSAGVSYAQTIKIDPGEAFNNNPNIIDRDKCIRVATTAEHDSIAFENLPEGSQREFLLTLHDIVNTNEATIESFFNRRGGEGFLVYNERSAEDFTGQLCRRRDSLGLQYADELAETLLEYEAQVQLTPLANTAAEEEALLQQLYYYIPPQLREGPEATEETEVAQTSTLEGVIEAFRADDSAKVLLLHGGSGVGKSLSLLKLKREALRARRDNRGASQVLHIDLKRYDARSVRDCVRAAVREAHMGGIRAVRGRPLLLLLDGYDEISGQYRRNLFQDNRLHKYVGLKVIITCRNQFLKRGYQCWFTPRNEAGAEVVGFQEYGILPFNEEQINAYLERYVGQHAEGLSLADYQHHIVTLPGLAALVRTPLILRIVCMALPRLLAQRAEQIALGASEAPEVSQAQLYDAFLGQWFSNQEARLRTRHVLPSDWSAVDSFYRFSTSLALAMCAVGSLDITYEAGTQGSAQWAQFFSQADEATTLARAGCPLRASSAGHYSFVHKSFWEYLTAQGLMAQLCEGADEGTDILHRHLRPAALVGDVGLLNFLRELYQDNRIALREQLITRVHASREGRERSSARMAALAITVLTLVDGNLSGEDFSVVRIPKAVLSHGYFHRTDFSGADVREVDMSQAYLAQASLQGARCRGVQFGELPWLKLERNINAISYSPDGQSMAIATGNCIEIWDLASETLLRHCEGHTGGVYSVSYSPDGQHLASGGHDRMVRQWSVNDGTALTVSEGHTSLIHSISYNPDGQRLASGSEDGTVRQWLVSNGAALTVTVNLGYQQRYFHSVNYSPDGQRFACSGNDKVVHQWSVNDWATLAVNLGYYCYFRSVSYSPDGQRLAYSGNDKMVRQWSVNDGMVLTVSKGHTSLVHSVSYSPDGQRLASGSKDGTVRQWSVNDGTALTVSEGHTGSVHSVSYSPDGQRLASGGQDRIVRQWLVNDGVALTVNEGHTGSVHSVSYSPDGQRLASGGQDRIVRQWSVNDGAALTVSEGHTGSVHSVSYSPDGQRLASASGGNDYMLRQWSVNDGTALTVSKGHLGGVYRSISFSYSPDGQRLAGSEDGTVRQWSVNDGAVLTVSKGHRNIVNSISYSPDGQRLASGSHDNTLRQWSVNDGVVLTVSKGHTDSVRSVSYSPDGQRLASGSWDKTVRQWSANDGAALTVSEGHTSNVNRVSYSQDGCHLISSANDGTIIVHSVQSQLQLDRLFLDTNVYAVAMSGTKNIASGDNSGAVKCWRYRPGANNKPRWVLGWSTHPSHQLVLKGCNIEGAEGLTSSQQRLLQQLNAEGGPVDYVAEAQAQAIANHGLFHATSTVVVKHSCIDQDQPFSAEKAAQNNRSCCSLS